jgi:hypothetical protein
MKAVFIGVFVAMFASWGQAPSAPDAAALVERAAQNQGHSLFVRDRCRYEQRLLMERFKYDKKSQSTGELLAKRQTTVVVEPAAAPDESGLIPVVTRVVADTNDKGEPKEKVDPNAQTGLASGAFLDRVFFPLLPENLRHLTFEEVKSETAGERWFRFAPNPSNRPEPLRPLASGIAQLDAQTGEVLTIRITGFSDLRTLDKHLEKIVAFQAVVDYSQFAGKLRMPTAAAGNGVSDVSRFQGFFKFVFEEGKYAPVGKID